MVLLFHLDGREPGETIVVNEDDDGEALFDRALRSLGGPTRLGIGARTWAKPSSAFGAPFRTPGS